LGAGITSGDHAKSYGAQFAVGSATGPFATAGLSAVQYDGIDSNGLSMGVSAGYSVDLTPKGTAQFCPLVGFVYQNGPDIETSFGTISSSFHAFELGGSFGGIAASSPGFDFVPFAGASFVLAQASASASGISQSENSNYGVVSAGAGFVINRTLTIQPAVNIPVGLDGGKASFSLSVGFNFGTAKPK
jgi:hypothetical protein